MSHQYKSPTARWRGATLLSPPTNNGTREGLRRGIKTQLPVLSYPVMSLLQPPKSHNKGFRLHCAPVSDGQFICTYGLSPRVLEPHTCSPSAHTIKGGGSMPRAVRALGPPHLFQVLIFRVGPVRSSIEAEIANHGRAPPVGRRSANWQAVVEPTLAAGFASIEARV